MLILAYKHKDYIISLETEKRFCTSKTNDATWNTKVCKLCCAPNYTKVMQTQ